MTPQKSSIKVDRCGVTTIAGVGTSTYSVVTLASDEYAEVIVSVLATGAASNACQIDLYDSISGFSKYWAFECTTLNYKQSSDGATVQSWANGLMCQDGNSYYCPITSPIFKVGPGKTLTLRATNNTSTMRIVVQYIVYKNS